MGHTNMDWIHEAQKKVDMWPDFVKIIMKIWIKYNSGNSMGL
jgi:hypothetical protein